MCQEESFSSFVSLEVLSRPLVHAWVENELWLLNFHEPLLCV